MFSFVNHISPHKFLGRKMIIFGFAWGELTLDDTMVMLVSDITFLVCSALQGTQDKLDDPFDGMSEDDINLDTIDEWTFGSLEHTMKRTFDVGRFKVTVDPKNDPIPPPLKEQTYSPSVMRRPDTLDVADTRSTRSSITSPLARLSSVDPVDLKKKYAPILEGMSGEERITRKSVYRKSSEVSEPSAVGNIEPNLSTIFEPITSSGSFEGGFEPADRKVTFIDEQLQQAATLQQVESLPNPLDAPEDVFNTQDSSIFDSLMIHQHADMIGLQRVTNPDPDPDPVSGDKTPAWAQMFKTPPPVVPSKPVDEPNDIYLSEEPPSSRFCTEPVETNGNEISSPASISDCNLGNENNLTPKPTTPIEKLTSPFSKFKVTNSEKAPLLSCVSRNGHDASDTQPLIDTDTRRESPISDEERTLALEMPTDAGRADDSYPSVRTNGNNPGTHLSPV